VRPLWGNARHIHFVGIGGVGMCALAEVLLDDGLVISGCDATESDRTRHLSARGATVEIGHDPSHVQGVDVLVVSAAIPAEHLELQAAAALGLPVIRRATLVAEVIRGLKSVAVAGTHGKTTTTALLTHLLDQAGANPTAVVGGLVRGLNGYGRRGTSDIAVCEADEFDQAFLELHPLMAVITNVETDHLDCYQSTEDLRAAFSEFAARPPFHGSVLICGDDPGASSLARSARAHVITYGLEPGNDLRAGNIRIEGLRSLFDVEKNGQALGEVTLSLTGDHNVQNALGALGAAMELGFDFQSLAKGCSDFAGVGRRFEFLGERRGVTVIDDYAHHPTEISAALTAARKAFPHRRIVAVFQPHLFSRTRDFADDFGQTLSTASLAIILPIFPAREEPIPGISHRLILQAIPNAIDGKSIDDVGPILGRELKAGDVLMTMGAGDVDRVASAWMRRNDG
jgi:UDP-N-acetylmuramate--alanine ligase